MTGVGKEGEMGGKIQEGKKIQRMFGTLDFVVKYKYPSNSFFFLLFERRGAREETKQDEGSGF